MLNTSLINTWCPGGSEPPGDWWNASWSHRQPVNVTNNDDSQLTYPVLINVSRQVWMQSDYCDLRFVNGTGTVLDYWVEEPPQGEWTTENIARAWVLVPFFMADEPQTIMVYSGNNAAGCVGNGTNVFPFFDDFDYPDGELPTVWLD